MNDDNLQHIEKTDKPKKVPIKILTKINIIGLLTFISGLIIGVGVPVWQNYWVEKPKLRIEVNGISRVISDDAGVFIDDHHELNILKSQMKRSSLDRYFLLRYPSLDMQEKSKPKKPGWVSPDELKELLKKTKEEFKELPDKITQREEDLERVKRISPATLSYADVSRLNRSLSKLVKVNSTEFKKKKNDFQTHSDYFKNILNDFQNRYKERLSDVRERYAELSTNLQSSEKKADDLIDEITKKRSYFVISSVLTNSGKENISIREPALFRVYIGTGNYVDLKLKLNLYKESAQLKAHGSIIASFQSKEVSNLPQEDQQLINNYWGKTVYGILFSEDIIGNIHCSNRMAFSEGLYQKLIYDRLANKASEKIHFAGQ